MSSNAQLQEELIGTYITRSATGLFMYECIITLNQEVDAVWRRKWTTITWLYALTRYCEALDQIVTFLPDGNLIGTYLSQILAYFCSACKALIHIDAALHLIQPLCYGWFSALRVYALLNDKILIAGAVFLLNLVPFATNMFNYVTTSVSSNDVCIAIPTISNRLHLSLSLLTRLAVILSDVLVLAVTWTKTAQAYGESRRLKIKAPLAAMLVRDGTLYFVILLISNVLEVMDSNIPAMSYLSITEPFFDILPQILVCRFILNLRQLEPPGSSWVSGAQTLSLHFVGNMGQSLHVGGEGSDDESFEDAEEVPFQAASSPEAALGFELGEAVQEA